LNITPPEPWLSFLTELDSLVGEATVLQCLGGFVVTQCYGLARSTGDFDVLWSVAPPKMSAKLTEVAGQGSAFSKKYRMHVDIVSVAELPYEYESRLIDIYPGVFKHLHLRVLDPYDVALAKLGRNNDRDRGDVLFLARTVPFDLDLFERRFREELEPDLMGNAREKVEWFQFWLEDIRDERANQA
jgi:hypothetical protein